MSRALPFLCALTLTVIGFQQLDDVGLNTGSVVAFGEILFQIRGAETDFVLLVGFRFPEDVEDLVHVQFPGLAQFLHLDSLGKRRCAVLGFHGFQKVMLFLPG